MSNAWKPQFSLGIKKAATDCTLEKDPTFLLVVFEWHRFGGENDAKAWIQKLGSTDDGFVRIVDQLKGTVTIHGMRDRVASLVPTVSAETLLKWFDGIEAKKRAEKLLTSPPNWLTTEQTESLRLLTHAIDADGNAVDLHRPGRRRGPSSSLPTHEVENQDEGTEEEKPDDDPGGI